MIKDTAFKFLKVINKNYYEKLQDNLAEEIYKKEQDPFSSEYKEINFFKEINQKVLDLGYNDLINKNYDNFNLINNINNINVGEYYLLLLQKNNKYDIISDVLLNKDDNLSSLKKEFNDLLFPKFVDIDRYDVERYVYNKIIRNSEYQQKELKNIIDIDNKEIKNMYIKELLRAIKDCFNNLYFETIHQKKIEAKDLLDLHLKDNLIVSKDDIKSFLIKFYQNNYNVIKDNVLLLEILEYTEFSNYEKYKFIKNNNFKDEYLIKYFLEENLEELSNELKVEKKYLELNNKEIDVSTFSTEKIQNLIDTISFINDTKDNSSKTIMLEKLNNQLNQNITIENLTSNIYIKTNYELKDISKEEFEKIEFKIKEKELEEFDNKLSGL